MPKKIIDKPKEFFGKSDENWDWENFLSTTNYPVSPNLIDWIIGQEHAIQECKLCINEWVNKLEWLNEKKWWKAFEIVEKRKEFKIFGRHIFWYKGKELIFNPKPTPKEMLPAGPFLLMLGDAGTGKSLLGRAMQSYMTNLYVQKGIKLYDTCSWYNKSLPSQPRISIHPSPQGSNIIKKAAKIEAKKGRFLKWGFKAIIALMIGMGLFILGYVAIKGISDWFYNVLWDIWSGTHVQEFYEGNFFKYVVESCIMGNIQIVMAGIMAMSMGGMLYLFSRFMGGMMGGNKKGTGGAESTQAPKLLIDNLSGIAPFIDATGHKSAQLFGSIAWDPYQTGDLGCPEHQRVTAGDVHRAHLGILYIDEIKNLTGDEAITLLTVLEDGQLPVAMRGSANGGDSITGDAMIFFKEDENIRYGQFSELIKSFENNNTIEVLSLEHMDFKCKKLVWTPVLKVFRRGKKPIKAVTLIDGKSIRLTKDHSLFRYNNLHSQKPLIPTTIEYGKCITINKIEVPKIDMESQSENDLEFYGYWIGDGHFEAGKIVGLATGRLEEDRDFVYSYAKKLGITTTLKNDKGDMRVYSTRLVRKMKTLGFVSGAFAKRIPEWIFFLPENKVKAFIKGYRRSDGSRYQKDRRMITQFGSVNRKLLEDFQTLFSILGIEVSISSGKLNGKKAFKSLNPQYQLTIWKDSSEDFEVNHLRNQGLLSLHRIRKIVDEEEAEVFDISTGNECFIANGILCHNTAAMAVATEPIPCMNFLIAAGNLDSLPMIHYALLDRIQGYGKMVYMSNDMPNTIENRRKYVQFISQEIKRFHLLPLSRDACMAVIEEAIRRSGKNNTITCKFRPMISVIKTSSVLAQNEGKTVVERKYVNEAISEHCKSIALQVMEKHIENQSLYNVLIDPTGEPKIGQIHGLAVSTINAQGTDFVGSVLTIRASCLQNDSPRKAGYFTVTGVATKDSSYVQHSIAKIRHVLLQLYGVDVEQDCYTHIDFAQDHGVEGPSAGITMTLALASVLLQKKIRQDVAVTGEINIANGDIQNESSIVITPIGGAHEKILAAQRMGFRGVCIPKRNFEKNINPKDYKIKIYSCETIKDYMKVCFVTENDKTNRKT